MKEFYSYPCEDCTDCPDFIDNGTKIPFEEFCKKYCDHCPDCIVIDIPYEEIEKRRKQNGNA